MSRLVQRTLCYAMLAALCIGTTVPAATISGYVREQGTQESMPYVSVFIEELRLGAMTNDRGYYLINGVPPGEHTLIASLIGYHAYREAVTVGDDGIIQNIVIASEAIEIESIQVEAERVRSPSLDIIPSRETFRGAELKIAPAAVEADPIRTLQTLPGVMQLSDFNTGLYVRGGTPDQNLILVDGAELYNVSHFFGLFSTFPADAIKTTELLTGGFPAQYGGRLSSVLNVVTDEGNKEEVHGIGGVSILSSRLTVEGPAAKGSFLVSGRRTYLEPILWMASKQTDALDGFGYYFYDAQAKVHQVLSHEDQYTFAMYFGRDDLSYDFESLNMRMAWGNWSGSFAWTHLFSPELYSHFQTTVSGFDSQLKFKFEDLGVQDDNEMFDVDTKADFTWFVNERHTFEFGGHLKRHNMQFAQEYAGQRYEAFDLVAFVPSGYVQDSWRPWPFLTLQPGLRVSYISGEDRNAQPESVNYGHNSGYLNWNPRFATRYQIGDDTFLKASVGRYTQYIFRVPREIQGISFLSDLWFTVDASEGGRPQHATHYIAGFETRLGKDLDLMTEIYYKDYDDIAEFNYRAEAPQTVGDALLRGDGFAYGLDFNIKKRAGRHVGWLSYSLGWTVREVAQINTIDPNDPLSAPQRYYPKYDQRHYLNAVYSWQLSRRWTINSRFAYASGQGYTPVLGVVVIEDPVYTLDPDYRARINERRLPAYARLDIGIRGNFQKWGVKWMPFFQIVNVLNRSNEFNRYSEKGEWDEPNHTYGSIETIPQLPFLPTFGIDVEF